MPRVPHSRAAPFALKIIYLIERCATTPPLRGRLFTKSRIFSILQQVSNKKKEKRVTLERALPLHLMLYFLVLRLLPVLSTTIYSKQASAEKPRAGGTGVSLAHSRSLIHFYLPYFLHRWFFFLYAYRYSLRMFRYR